MGTWYEAWSKDNDEGNAVLIGMFRSKEEAEKHIRKSGDNIELCKIWVAEYPKGFSSPVYNGCYDL